MHFKWCISNLNFFFFFFPSCSLSHLLLNRRFTVPETSGGKGWWPQAGRGRRSPDTQSRGWAASTCGYSAEIAAYTSQDSDKRKMWAFCVDRSQRDYCELFLDLEKNIMFGFGGAIFHNYWVWICVQGLRSQTVDILFLFYLTKGTEIPLFSLWKHFILSIFFLRFWHSQHMLALAHYTHTHTHKYLYFLYQNRTGNSALRRQRAMTKERMKLRGKRCFEAG